MLTRGLHLRPGSLHSHKQSKQTFSDVWSNMCFLWSCPHSLSSDLSRKAGWLQQAVFTFRSAYCCKIPGSQRPLPTAAVFVPRIYKALVSFPHQKTDSNVRAPSVQAGQSRSQRDMAAASLPPFLPGWTIRQWRRAVAKSVEVKRCSSFFSSG